MEKLMIFAQLPADANADAFRADNLATLRRELQQDSLKVQSANLLIEDSATEAAAALRMENDPPLPQVVLSLWLASANVYAELASQLQSLGLEGLRAYLVSESEVLQNPKNGISSNGIGSNAIESDDHNDGRSEGSVQLCTFRALPELSQREFIARWRGDHTAVALETQSTTAYRQNLVTACLADDSSDNHDNENPVYAAIVEEQFPTAAMSSQEVFYDAVGDPEKLTARQQQMGESCARFIDFSSINVVHMSEYCLF